MFYVSCFMESLVCLFVCVCVCARACVCVSFHVYGFYA